TDAAGRAVPGIDVLGVPLDDHSGAWGFSQSLADGSFSLTNLKAGTYTVVAQSPTGTFALRPGVTSGSKGVALALQPGAGLAGEGQKGAGPPTPGAWPSGTNGNAAPVGALGHATAPTNAQGATELLVPPGSLTVLVRKGPQRGTATVSVSAGESAAVTVRLGEEGPAQ